MNEELLLYDKLKRMTINLGGTLFGVADVIPYRPYFNLSPEEYQNLHRGISIGVLLSEYVLDAITTHPTLLYKWHYRQANNLLDHIAFRISQFIIQAGYRAVAIPASQVTDWEKHSGHLSHRSMAEKAGLGWRGRNNLLVTQQYGSHVRLVSVLTDMPLKPDESMVNKCGRCMKCVHSCPAGALGNHSDDYDINKCYTLLTGYSRMPGIGAHICGICVKSCKGRKGIRMNIRKLVMGPLETNCYVITDEKTSHSIVIDPADENKDLKQLAEDSNTTVDKILLTHGHFDHIGGVNVIQRLTGAELWIHSLDEEMLRDPSKNMSSFFENRIVCSEPSYHFKDDTILECGSLRIKVIHTPGHTLGSSCFLIDGALFSGDTLFQMGIGRTDFPYSSTQKLLESIQNKLLCLDSETLVYPGHGPQTTIGREKKGNPFLA